MYKVLIVDDEPPIRELVAKYCTLEGYAYGEAGDGLEAIEKVRDGNYDIVIMDVMMPELDGFSAVREIRKFSKIPVIMLSARTETYDKIHGFEIGADDYLPKPFSPKELMLRANAVMSRSGAGGDKEVFESGKLKVDFTARIVYVDSKPVDLSPKEYELLFFMVKNRGIARGHLIFAAEGHEDGPRADGGIEAFGKPALGAGVEIARKRLHPFRKIFRRRALVVFAALRRHRDMLFRAVGI